MEDHTIGLLQECSQGCKMGIKSMNQVEEYVSGDKLKKVIDKCIEEHKTLESEADHLLMWHGQDSKPPEKLSAAMSWFSTEMKLMMNDNDKQAAKILMDGCNMGIQSIMEVLHTNPGADKKSKEIAKEIIAEEERFVEEIKPFL